MRALSRCSAVLIVSLLCAGEASAQLASAIGMVVDSVHGRPLAGATILISGAEVQAVTDSNGRFRIDSIPAGDHTMAVLHPFLDEIGLTLATNKITFAPGATMSVLLATPSAETWIGHRCTDADRKSGPAAVIGHVLQLTTDDPLTGALVHYSATMVEVSAAEGLKHVMMTRDVAASPSGDFTVCGLPSGHGAVRATKGRVSTGDIPVDLSGALLAGVTLRLEPNDTLATHTGSATGRIVDDKGVPVPAARVTLQGGVQTTQTSDSGRFTLRDLPQGSQVLDIEKLGFPTIGVSVTILGPQQPTVVAVALPPPTRRNVDALLTTVGFVQRRAAGGDGVFITADTIEKRKARYIADLQSLFPGLLRVTSPRGPLLVPTHAGVAQCIWYVVDNLWYETNAAANFTAPPRPFQLYAAPVTSVPGGQVNDAAPAAVIAGIEYYQYGHIPKDLLARIHTRGFPKCSLMAVWTFRSVGAPD